MLKDLGLGMTVPKIRVYISSKTLDDGMQLPSAKRLNVGSSPTVGAVFSAMKAEYVVVAEQAHPLGPAYSFPKQTST